MIVFVMYNCVFIPFELCFSYQKAPPRRPPAVTLRHRTAAPVHTCSPPAPQHVAHTAIDYAIDTKHNYAYG